MEVMGEWGENYTRAAFIDTGAPDGERYEKMAKEQAERRNWEYEKKIGNQRMLLQLLSGDWSEEEFLFVPPGHQIKQSFDDKLICAEPTEAGRMG